MPDSAWDFSGSAGFQKNIHIAEEKCRYGQTARQAEWRNLAVEMTCPWTGTFCRGRETKSLVIEISKGLRKQGYLAMLGVWARHERIWWLRAIRWQSGGKRCVRLSGSERGMGGEPRKKKTEGLGLKDRKATS